MRRSLLVLVLMTGLVAGAVASSSAADLSDDPSMTESLPFVVSDSEPQAHRRSMYAVGGGQTGGGIVNFSLSAHIGPNGDFGQVHVKQSSPEISYMADVFCVHIHAPQRAVIRGIVKKVEPVPNAFGLDEGEVVIFGVEDMGSPSDPVNTDDFFNINGDAFPTFSCKNLVYVANVDNVTQGNIIVSTQ